MKFTITNNIISVILSFYVECYQFDLCDMVHVNANCFSICSKTDGEGVSLQVYFSSFQMFP